MDEISKNALVRDSHKINDPIKWQKTVLTKR